MCENKENKESNTNWKKDVEHLETLMLCLITTHLFFIIQLFYVIFL